MVSRPQVGQMRTAETGEVDFQLLPMSVQEGEDLLRDTVSTGRLAARGGCVTQDVERAALKNARTQLLVTRQS
eukprot:4620343-Pleurochrysis_carterae.AAC.1